MSASNSWGYEADHSVEPTAPAADGLLRPEQAAEYLQNLQDSLDVAVARSERLAERVRRLERDRDVLRERLQESRETQTGPIKVRARMRRLRRGKGSEHTSGPSATAPTPPAPATMRSADLPVVGRIGPVDWPEPSPPRDLRIGLVADAFTTMSLQYEAECLPLRASDGAEVLRRHGADLLFVESAYRGPGGTWHQRIARFGEPHDDLVRLVETARSLGIPTVFWNKEDPVNSDWFVASAGLFDHTFTVDANRVRTYRSLFGHDRVHVLPFAAQPRIHRPPERFEDRTGPILFAGTWFARKHPARRAQLEMLLDPARNRGLQILDRNGGRDARFLWPDRFREHIVGSLPYPLAVEAARRYRVVVNVNTVTDSPTMCSRRVFELAASATPIVSGPSEALRTMAPDNIARIVTSTEEADEAYDGLINNPKHAREVGEIARQWVLAEHTWTHRLYNIVQAVGVH